MTDDWDTGMVKPLYESSESGACIIWSDLDSSLASTAWYSCPPLRCFFLCISNVSMYHKQGLSSHRPTNDFNEGYCSCLYAKNGSRLFKHSNPFFPTDDRRLIVTAGILDVRHKNKSFKGRLMLVLTLAEHRFQKAVKLVNLNKNVDFHQIMCNFV